jgi:hypothetical protein
LLTAFLYTNRDDEVGPLLHQYDDPSALWLYGWALWAFRRDGDGPASREQLRAAVRSNRYVPGYLTGASEWEGFSPEEYAMGSREEAVICDEEIGDAWHVTPGAIEWLAAHATSDKRRKRRR